MKSHGLKIAVSLLLTGVLLYFFFKGVDPQSTREAILNASPFWLSAAVLLGVGTFVFRAARWTWILRPVARVPLWPAFSATASGFAANNLPGKVGEVLRPYLLSRLRGLPFSPLFASILLERVFDGASVIFFFLLALWSGLPRSQGFGKLLVPAGALVFLVALVVFAVTRRAETERFLEKIWRRLPEKLQPRLREFGETFVDGFSSLKSPRLLLAITAGSLGMWLVINLQIYCVMRAFAVDLPFSASFVVTAAAVLGLAVPTPGGLGSYQIAVLLALTDVYAVSRSAATSVAIAAWLTSFVPITLIGLALFVFSMKGIRFRDAMEPGGGGRQAGDGAR